MTMIKNTSDLDEERIAEIERYIYNRNDNGTIKRILYPDCMITIDYKYNNIILYTIKNVR